MRVPPHGPSIPLQSRRAWSGRAGARPEGARYVRVRMRSSFLNDGTILSLELRLNSLHALLTFVFASLTLRAASPLDSITAEEIVVAVKAVKGSSRYVEGSLFAIVALNEPPKGRILRSEESPIPREAFV